MKIPKALLFCFALQLIVAQQPNDPKVGLILSGGGAKGMAHVGVLKEIERAGVRIDYIGGTSMGAIVGGLYACGYSATQLEQLLITTNLTDLINDNFDRNSKSFHDKEDSERYAITLPIVKGKIQFPLSISKGQNVYNLLVQLMHNQRNIDDFSKLPTPFFCVATDINNGEKVLLDKGFLPLAVNASSTLPTLFSPVTIGDHSLIDGGVSDNYPIDEMLQKDIDVVIGVDVQSDIELTTKATTFSEVLMRISSLQTEKTMMPKKEKTHVYIRPNMQGFNMLSFSEQTAIIERGALAGKKAFPELVQLAEKQKPNTRTPIEIPSSFKLDALHVPQTSNYKKNYLAGKIRLTPSNDYPFVKLRQGMTNLAATQNFDTFRYTLTTENGKETLSLDLDESPHNTLFRGGLQYNDLTGASALANITQKHAILKNDEVSFDLIFGEYFRYDFSYFIDKGLFWSIGLTSTLNQFETKAPFLITPTDSPSVLESPLTQVYVQKNTFYAQTFFREEALLGLGVAHQKQVLKTNFFESQSGQFLHVDDSDYYSMFGYMKIDTRDNAYFPKKGGFFSGSAAYYFSQKTTEPLAPFSPFLVGKAEMGLSLSPHKKWALSINTMGGFTIRNANTSAFDFILGGYGNAPLLNYQPFVGLPQQHVAGDSFVKGEIVFDYNLLPRHHARLLFHTAIINNDIFSTKQWLKTPNFFGTGLAYGLETFAGPIEFTTAYSPQVGKLVYHVSLGWRF